MSPAVQPPKMKNKNFQNPINQMENTPLVSILATDTNKKQSTAVDTHNSVYTVDLAKTSFGGIKYPTPGSQWHLKKVSGTWTLMSRAAQQNPQLSNTITPAAGDTVMGTEGKTYITGTGITANGLTVNGSLALVEPTAGTTAISTKVTGDTNPRLSINADGTHNWGPGNAATDTNLYRSGVQILRTDSNFIAGGEIKTVQGSAGNNAYSGWVNGEANPRVLMEVGGTIHWGAGGGSAVDTNLYRTSAGLLTTDSNFLANNTILTSQGSAAGNGFMTYVNGEANQRWSIDIGGMQHWGAGGGSSTDTNLYRSAAGTLKTDSNMVIAGTLILGPGANDVGRGLICFGGTTGSTSAAGTGGTVVISAPTATYKNGRAFRGTLMATYQASVANVCTIDIVNGVGTRITGIRRTPTLNTAATQYDIMHQWVWINTSGSDQSTGVQVKLTSSTGTVTLIGAVSQPVYFMIEDIGASSGFAGFPSM